MLSQPHFIETIRLIDGKPQLLSYHEERIRRSLVACGAGLFFNLEVWVNELIARCDLDLSGVCKCRFEYDVEGIYTPSISTYIPRCVERLYTYPIRDPYCYRYKYSDRHVLSQHLLGVGGDLLKMNTECVFTYQGLLTDTPYSNIVLDMGDGQWLTPRRPLLNGVMRQFLLDEGRIQEADLSEEDLLNCRTFQLINAMLSLGS